MTEPTSISPSLGIIEVGSPNDNSVPAVEISGVSGQSEGPTRDPAPSELAANVPTISEPGVALSALDGASRDPPPSSESVPDVASFTREDLSKIAGIQASFRGKLARRKLQPQVQAVSALAPVVAETTTTAGSAVVESSGGSLEPPTASMSESQILLKNNGTLDSPSKSTEAVIGIRIDGTGSVPSESKVDAMGSSPAVLKDLPQTPSEVLLAPSNLQGMPDAPDQIVTADSALLAAPEPEPSFGHLVKTASEQPWKAAELYSPPEIHQPGLPWFLQGMPAPVDQKSGIQIGGTFSLLEAVPPSSQQEMPVSLPEASVTLPAREIPVSEAMVLVASPPPNQPAPLASVRQRIRQACLREADLRMEAEMAAMDSQELLGKLQNAEQLAQAEGQLRRQYQAEYEKVKGELQLMKQNPAVQQATELKWQLSGATAAIKALERQVQAMRMEARYETERRERAERDLRDERSRSRSLGAVSSLSRRVLPSMASAIAEREGAESSDPLAGTIECSDSDWDENAKGICNLQDQVAKLTGALSQSQRNNSTLLSWAVPKSGFPLTDRVRRAPLLIGADYSNAEHAPEPGQVRSGRALDSPAFRLQNICQEIHEARSRSNSPPRRYSLQTTDQETVEEGRMKSHVEPFGNSFAGNELTSHLVSTSSGQEKLYSNAQFGSASAFPPILESPRGDIKAACQSSGPYVPQFQHPFQGASQQNIDQNSPPSDKSDPASRNIWNQHLSISPNKMPEEILKVARLEYSYEKNAVRQKRLRELQES